MNLGTETASVVNNIMSSAVGAPTPEVGMGCTILKWSDRVAATIIKVTAKTIDVQEDLATRIDNNGMSESQRYTYERDPKGTIRVFRLTKNGWRLSGGGWGLGIGYRQSYHDYSF
jgi:hypothetical protein